ncbi:hypothetical protein NARC_40243 [Candidatus Nitrosocosmicus arcticus]|uniref:Uncharacterized protein n=1 Tax=Candidatus Nitrosocosmicus arcticus TaxID=2035267 RepID=A0A557SXE1_9ARCH|nr:hypothetical protein NARC_40243 [Candidatus Nitrosocosmicus arcticus]
MFVLGPSFRLLENVLEYEQELLEEEPLPHPETLFSGHCHISYLKKK